MTYEELQELMRTTWELEDAAQRTVNAVRISDGLEEMHMEIEKQRADMEALKNKIDDLRRVNSELYSRVTVREKEKEKDANPEPDLIKEVLEVY